MNGGEESSPFFDYICALTTHVLKRAVTIFAAVAIVTMTDAQVLRTGPVLPDNVRPLFIPDTVSICVMGDMMMHTRQIEEADKGDGVYDFSSYFSLIEDRIKGADIAVANMEFTLSGEPYTGYPAFSAPDAYALYLASCGFDVFLTANNHIYDRRGFGAERTLKKYRELEAQFGVRVTGTAESQQRRDAETPLFVHCKGMSIAFVNFTYGTNLGSDTTWPKTNYMSDRSLILDALSRAESADFTLVLPHWGDEYTLEHSQEQEETACWLADNGADMIIGSHPHVPQGFDVVSDRKVPVAYSLGNAVSNMSAKNTQLELMAMIDIVRNPNGDIKVQPVRFTYLWCSRPGGFSKTFTVLPVKEYIGKRHLWKGGWDYDKMIGTYERVKAKIKIEDN